MPHNGAKTPLWNTASTLPYPDNQTLIEHYPFDAHVLRIPRLFDSPLEVKLLMPTSLIDLCLLMRAFPIFRLIT